MEARGRIAERVDEILRDRPAYGEMLRFFQSVLEILEQEAADSKVRQAQSPGRVGHERFPLRNRGDLQPNHADSLRVFRQLVALEAPGNELLTSDLRRLRQAEEVGRLHLEGLVWAFLRDDAGAIGREAGEIGVNAEVLKFALATCIRPSVEQQSRRLRHLVDATWSGRTCPICGSLPFLSELRAREGKRYLICSFCGHRWPTARLGCAFCGTSAREDLHYFQVEGQRGLRVDLCDACNRYIKTLDTRDWVAEPHPLLEDLASLHLDLLAQREGYTRGSPDPLGIIESHATGGNDGH
jgi:FdhE protein